MRASRRRASAPARASARSAIWCGSWRPWPWRIRVVRSASSAARISSTRSPSNSRSMAPRRGASLPSPAGSAKAASVASTEIAPHSASARSRKARRRHAMGGDGGGDAIGRVEPLAGQRAIGAKLARHPRQEPGRADVGEKSDADLRHRERKAVAGDAMRAVHRKADAAAHDDAVDQRDIGLGIVLDDGVEDIFLAIERQHLVVPAGGAGIIERADIAARRERPAARRRHHHARDRGIVPPILSTGGSAPAPCRASRR